MIRKVLALSAPILTVLTLCACTDTSGAAGDPDDVVKAEAKGAPAQEGDRVALGRLEDEDLRKMIHTELEKRITKTGAVGDGAEEATELGDGDSFQYTVVKLSRGPDDVSGDPSEVPDGVEVEVNGWYKRSLAQKEAKDPEVACMSFDTYTHLVKKAGKWVVPDDYQVVFNREDSEDCY